MTVQGSGLAASLEDKHLTQMNLVIMNKLVTEGQMLCDLFHGRRIFYFG